MFFFKKEVPVCNSILIYGRSFKDVQAVKAHSKWASSHGGGAARSYITNRYRMVLSITSDAECSVCFHSLCVYYWLCFKFIQTPDRPWKTQNFEIYPRKILKCTFLSICSNIYQFTKLFNFLFSLGVCNIYEWILLIWLKNHSLCCIT